jgi:hypothetical protein
MSTWVVFPEFLRGKAADSRAEEAQAWCREHCTDRWLSSAVFPWTFLSRKDAVAFQQKYGGKVEESR